MVFDQMVETGPKKDTNKTNHENTYFVKKKNTTNVILHELVVSVCLLSWISVLNILTLTKKSQNHNTSQLTGDEKNK